MPNEAIIYTELDTKGVEDGAKRVEKEMSEMAGSAKNSNQSIEELSARLKELLNTKKQLEDSGYGTGFVQYDAVNAEIAAIRENLNAISEIESIESKINGYKKALVIDTEKKPMEGITKEIEKQGNAAERTSAKIKQMKETCNRTSQSIKRIGDSVKKSNSGFVSGLKNIVKYALGVQGLLAAINKLRSTLVEGFKNLAQFNNGVNPTNTALSNLKSALTQLKNSFAVAFAPILTVVEPILTRLISLLSSAMNTIGQFFAALTGAKTFNNAIKAQENYAKSLKGTASAAKKTKNELYSFDELNVVKQNDDSSGGVSGGASVSPNQMFEEIPIESALTSIADKVAEFANPFKESLLTWLSGLDFTPLINSFSTLWEHISPIVDLMQTGLLWILEHVLEPLGKWTIEEGIPSFFEALGGALDLISAVASKLGSWFSDLWYDFLAPAASWAADAFVTTMETLGKVFTDIANNETAVTVLSGVVVVIGAIAVAIGLWSAAQAILNAVMAISPITWIILGIMALIAAIVLCITYWDEIKETLVKVWDTIKKTVTDKINLIKETLSNVMKKIKDTWNLAWDAMKTGVIDIFNGIWNGIKGVINKIISGIETMVNSVINGINTMINALNSISFDIPDWVPGLGGKSFGINIPTITPISLPRLASGTVVPRQSKEFAAILGDNNRETEVVSPLSTIEQALRNVMNDVNICPEIVIHATGDNAGFVKYIKYELDKENKRIGRSFAY